MIVLPLGTILILTILFQQKFASKEAGVFYAFAALKYLCAVLVGFLYQYYYQISGDTFTVYHQAKEWYEAMLSGNISWQQWIGVEVTSSTTFSNMLPTEPRTRFFAFIISYLMPVSFKSYYALACWLTFFQLASLWILARNLIQNQHLYKWVVFIGLLFIPSIAFWSAGLLKETLMLTLMAIILTAYLYWKDESKVVKWRYIVVVVLASIILFKLKYYVVIVLLPLGFTTYFFSESVVFQNTSLKLRMALYFLIIALGLFLLAVIHPVFYSGRFFELIKISHDHIAQYSTDALIYFVPDVDAFRFTVINIPLALIAAFFRPFLWEWRNPLMIGLAVESSVFMLLFAVSLLAIFKLKLKEKQYWWLLGIWLYVIAIGLIVTLSTPNFGSLARYKVAFMPFCWISCLWLANKYFSVRKL